MKELTKKQKAKRSQILAAAANAFIENGFERTNVDEIIRHSGGSKSTVYKYFGSKEELFVTVAAYISERLNVTFDFTLDKLATPENATLEDVKSSLHLFSRLYLKNVLTPANSDPLWMLVSSSRDVPRASLTFLEKGPVRATQIIAGHFQRWKRLGLIHVDDESLAAEQFLGMLRCNIMMSLFLSTTTQELEDDAAETIAQQAVHTFLFGACGNAVEPIKASA